MQNEMRENLRAKGEMDEAEILKEMERRNKELQQRTRYDQQKFEEKRKNYLKQRSDNHKNLISKTQKELEQNYTFQPSINHKRPLHDARKNQDAIETEQKRNQRMAFG
jgi:hypothetical protein